MGEEGEGLGAGEGWGGEGSSVPAGASVGEKHGFAPQGTEQPELEPCGSGALSTSSGSLNWPGRPLHRPAQCTEPPYAVLGGQLGWLSSCPRPPCCEHLARLHQPWP